jgi:hypothetical protein
MSDFTSRQGDLNVAQATRNDRNRWGRRALLATVPSGNPNLHGLVATNKATLIDTGPLNAHRPVHVEVRFCVANVGNAQPLLPFTDICFGVPATPAVLTFTIRRGIDPNAPMTEDQYTMQIGVGTGVNDRVPFDIITCRSLGIDVAISGNTNHLSNIWIEAIATPVDLVSERVVLGGYNGVTVSSPAVIPASAVQVTLAPRRMSRTQVIITNTSTNANLWVAFGQTVTVGSATLVIPANQFARYESPIKGYCGVISGIWDNATPNGTALVTEGVNI